MFGGFVCEWTPSRQPNTSAVETDLNIDVREVFQITLYDRFVDSGEFYDIK